MVGGWKDEIGRIDLSESPRISVTPHLTGEVLDQDRHEVCGRFEAMVRLENRVRLPGEMEGRIPGL